jgi:hypothetical protein
MATHYQKEKMRFGENEDLFDRVNRSGSEIQSAVPLSGIKQLQMVPGRAPDQF